jgi:hypothetical protein
MNETNPTTIFEFGLNAGASPSVPNPVEVEVCREFILAFGVRTKTIRRVRTSYGLKHQAEAWSKAQGGVAYVTNGAFIQAAHELDIPFARCGHSSPNAFFALSWPRAGRAP